MAKRGRPKKDGLRFPSGKLRPLQDQGHELTLAHRAAVAPGANPTDFRHGYPLGVLRLRNEIDEAEHQAGLAYACIRALAGPRAGGEIDVDSAAWGSDWRHIMPQMPKSELARMVAQVCAPLETLAEDRHEERARRCAKQAREAAAYILIDGKRPLEVLEAVTVYETVGPEAYLSRRDHEALQAALGRLVTLWKIPRDK